MTLPTDRWKRETYCLGDNMEYTQGPLKVDLKVNDTYVRGPNGELVADTHTLPTPERQNEERANAEHIVLCWNAHDKLLEALKDFATAVWSDSRLPREMRKDLEALYHNTVWATLRISQTLIT